MGHGAVSGLFGMGAIASLVSLFEKIRVLTNREIRNYHRFSYVVFVQSRQSMYQKLRLFMKFLNPQKNLGYRIDYRTAAILKGIGHASVFKCKFRVHNKSRKFTVKNRRSSRASSM